MMNLRELIQITVLTRATTLPDAAYHLYKNSAADIAARLDGACPQGSSTPQLIEWLTTQIRREEFSAIEDVMDGSIP